MPPLQPVLGGGPPGEPGLAPTTSGPDPAPSVDASSTPGCPRGRCPGSVCPPLQTPSYTVSRQGRAKPQAWSGGQGSR